MKTCYNTYTLAEIEDAIIGMTGITPVMTELDDWGISYYPAGITESVLRASPPREIAWEDLADHLGVDKLECVENCEGERLAIAYDEEV